MLILIGQHKTCANVRGRAFFPSNGLTVNGDKKIILKKEEKMSTYPVLVFGTGVSGDVILVLAVFNTSRHASTDNETG